MLARISNRIRQLISRSFREVSTTSSVLIRADFNDLVDIEGPPDAGIPLAKLLGGFLKAPARHFCKPHWPVATVHRFVLLAELPVAIDVLRLAMEYIADDKEEANRAAGRNSRRLFLAGNLRWDGCMS